MRKFGLLGTSALRSAAFIGAAVAMASPAYAQDDPQGEDQPANLQSEAETESGENATTGAQGESAEEGQPITVTGSRIRRPNLESTVPITSIGGEEFIQSGDTNIGETLNELPQLRSTFSQQNPGLGIGIAGLNLLDLRGLGTVRTLTLVNGRRHVAADILNNAVSPDINTIPNDLIERVDIVTGAQSSIYGSDAIAGVVNFVLRRNFEGLQLRGNAAVSGKAGYAGEQYVSAMYGMNFGDDSGNITLHAEYAIQDRVFGSDVPQLRQTDGLLTVDVDGAGALFGSDGVPDRVFVRDLRSATIHRFSLVPVSQVTGGPAPCGVSTSSPTPATTPNVPFNCTFIFGPEGRLVAQTGNRVGTTINGSFLGGNGQTGREEELLSLLPYTERYNFNLLAHYEFSPALELFAEGKWVRVNAQGSNASPSFTQGGSFDANRERIRLDNPFLNPADRATIANAILASNCVPTITGAACPATTNIGTTAAPVLIPGNLTAAQRAQITAGTFRFPIGKQFTDLGIRDEVFQRDTWRVVVGARGTFNEDWNYEISANYGKFEEDSTQFGFLDRQRFLLAMDSGIDPATGTIRCRSQFDPAAAFAFQSAALNTSQNAFIASRLASDIAACVPYNPFGAGTGNAAAVDYFKYNTDNHAELEQIVFSGFVSGDTSQLFELPGGAVRFALGAEYRREKALYENDPFVLQGATNAVVIGIFDPQDPLEVKEAYGEIQIPILADMPFFEELTLTAAGRVSDYKGRVGTVYAYNAGVDWAPVRDIRFRAGYGRSVRAPNISETGFPVVPNFAPGFVDPCSGGAIANNPNRQANCLADLGAALLANLATLGAPSLNVLSGSNPDLLEETSDSYTLGAVIQPRWVPGLSFSADYFDIEVKDVIVSLSAQAIANNCYDAPSLNNPFCPIFTRWRGPGTGPLQEIPGQILGNSLTQAGVNFASLRRRGIDFELAYRTNITDDVRLNTNLIYVHNLETSNFTNPADPEFENRVLGELGDPQDEFRWDTDLTYRNFTFGYRMRYIGEMVVNLYEDFNELPGACRPPAPCPPNNLDFADTIEYPETFYHDIRFEWNVPAGGIRPELQFYTGIDNLLNTFPPLGLSGSGTGGAGADRGTGNAAIYEALGRTFYAGVRARF
jgi:outer membrane receptor protein involved in Fe transport